MLCRLVMRKDEAQVLALQEGSGPTANLHVCASKPLTATAGFFLRQNLSNQSAVHKHHCEHEEIQKESRQVADCATVRLHAAAGTVVPCSLAATMFAYNAHAAGWCNCMIYVFPADTR